MAQAPNQNSTLPNSISDAQALAGAAIQMNSQAERCTWRCERILWDGKDPRRRGSWSRKLGRYLCPAPRNATKQKKGSFCDKKKRSGGVAMRDRLAALAVVAVAGAILSCSNAGAPDIDSQQNRGSSAGNGQDQPGATLYPIRYGYRGGPYTSGGKPRQKTDPW